MSKSLIQRLEAHSHSMPDRVALSGNGESWTWSQLDGASAILGTQLARDLPAESVVLLSSPNDPAFTASFLGIVRAGMHVFPLSPSLTAPELIEFADACGAAAIIGTEPSLQIAGRNRLAIKVESLRELRSARAPAAPRNGERSALLLLSSGTTGRPRIVRRPGVAIDAISQSVCEAVGFAASDHVLSVVPLCHAYGLEHGLLGPVWAGSQMHIFNGFDLPSILAQFAAGITIFPGVPFMFESLAHAQKTDRTALRRAYSAGGPLPLPVARDFAENFGISVGQIYGTTEVASVTFSDPEQIWFNPQSVGRPMRGVRIRVDPATNEIEISAPSMLNGYADGKPVGSGITADGYFLTGDMGRIDDNGNLLLSGRLKLLIDIGGLKVNPLEVEGVLADHPAVDQCVVVPMQLSGTVTRLKAVVAFRAGQTAPSAGDLRQFVKQRLASYKVPRVFEIRDRLPRSATGKILRQLIMAE